MKKGLRISFFLLFLGISTYIFFSYFLSFLKENFFQEKVCPLDVKVCLDGTLVSRVFPECNFAPCLKEDLIELNNLRAHQIIESPLVLQGRARGYWFFEADFPVKLLDANGNLMAMAVASAQAGWMTEEFVPFEVKLEFDVPDKKRGEIVFEKDNPSGLAEHADELRVPVRFKN